MSNHYCGFANCQRSFLDVAGLAEHADAVHSFNDIECLLREKYGTDGNQATGAGGTYVWVADLATDWVVFQVETGSDSNLYKANYTIDANNAVTLSEPVEVVRRTVYDPVTAADQTPGTLPGLEGAAAAKKPAAKSAAPAGDAQMVAAQKSMTPAQFALYKSMRAKGMVHALASKAAMKVKG